MKVSRGYIPAVLYVAYSTQRRHNVLTVWPGYAMLFNIPCSRPWNSRGEGRSAVRCCGLFSCLQLVPPAWGPAGKRRGPPSVGMPLLADAPTRLKGMRACLAAARLRLYPDSAAAAAPPGRARSAGGAAAPPGRPSLRVARRSGFAAAALRSGRGRRSAPRLRPSAPSRRLRGSRLCPRARWAALSLSPVARGPPLRPRCARSPVSPPPARPGSPPRLAPGSAPAGGLRGRLAGRCAPARRPLGGRPAPPRFGALRRGGCRCGGKRESRPRGRLSGKAFN